MEIELHKVRIGDLVEGFKDEVEGGVVAYGGKLNVRPKYQREFVYSGKQRDDVVRSVIKGWPLNVMYWAKSGELGFEWEMLDGQQRTISLCQFVAGVFSLDGRYFTNWTDDEQKRFYDYEVMVYHCDGTNSERLDWFKIINIAGEKLTDQELRNAIFSGPFVSDAKRYFSRNKCAAEKVAEKYVKLKAIRQEYLEKALAWISDGTEAGIEDYMGLHQMDQNAQVLWEYYLSVVNWALKSFPVKRPELLRVDWGKLYQEYSDMKIDPKKLEKKIKQLLADSDVTRKHGIYEYLLSGDERCLSIRTFDDDMRSYAYTVQDGKCKRCGKTFPIEEMHADHITPWSKGGRTVAENCQMLCAPCNRTKSAL